MTVYATRLINGTDSRERLRRADALSLFPTGVGTARGGFRNDGGGAVSVNAGTMTVAVTPFMAYVDGGVSDAQGGYTFVSDATETLTVSPGHASLSRTDVVIAEVRDTTHDGSGSTDARVRILEGAPGSGVPALPTNALALRNITVPAGLSAGTGGLASGNLGTDRRTYTTGLGGVLTVASQAERDALPAIDGSMVYRADTDTVELLKAGTWTPLVAKGDQLVVKGGSHARALVAGSNTFTIDITAHGFASVASASVVGVTDSAHRITYGPIVTVLTPTGITVNVHMDGNYPSGISFYWMVAGTLS